MTIKSITRWFSLFLLSVLIIGSSLFFWIYTTESGFQWIAQQSKAFLPKELSFGQVNGKLSDTIELSDFSWKDEQQSSSIDAIQLNCQWLELLSNRFKCESIHIRKILVIVNDTLTEETTSPNINLPQINIPLELDISTIAIESITKEDNKQGTQTQSLYLKQTQVSQLKIQQSRISFDSVATQFQGTAFTLKGFVTPNSQWPHELLIKADSNDLSVQLNSSGQLTEKALLNVETQLPITSKTQGEWRINNGLFLNETHVTLDEQSILVNDFPLSIHQHRSEITLHWPDLIMSNNSLISWQQFEKISVHSSIETKNIVQWTEDTKLDFSLEGILNESHLNVLKSSYLPLKQSNTTPVKDTKLFAKVEALIKENNLQIDSKQISLGELTAQFNIKSHLQKSHPNSGVDAISIAGVELNNLRISGFAHAKDLTTLVGFPIKNLNAKWEVEHLQNNELLPWKIESNGSIDALSIRELELAALKWQIALDKQWKGKLKLSRLKQDNVNLKDIRLNITGSQESHNISGQLSQQENHTASFQFNGKLKSFQTTPSNLKATQWVIENFQSKITSPNNSNNSNPTSSESLRFEAKRITLATDMQSFESFCIKQSGSICFSGNKDRQTWSSNANIKSFDLALINTIANQWQLPLPIDFNGALDGKVNASGSTSQLNLLDINLSMPLLTLSKDNVSASIKSLSITNKKVGSDYFIDTQWQSLQAKMSTQVWQSSLESVRGEINISIANNYDTRLQFTQNNIKWSLPYTANDKSLGIFEIPSIDFKGSIINSEIKGNLELKLLGEDHINGQMKTRWPIVSSQPINANIDILLSQFAWLKQWQSRIDQLEGSWKQNATITGSLDNPLINGSGDIKINRFELEELGIDIENSFIQVKNNNTVATLTGSLTNKQGTLLIDGETSFYPTLSASARVRGQKVVLLRSKDNTVVVSPNILTQFSNNHFDISGSIVIDEAKIKISGLPKQAIKISDDQIIVNQVTEPTSPFTYKANLNIEASDNVSIDGFGLSSHVQGKLQALARTGKPITLNGQLTLKNGKFEAYKQILTIEEGQLLFLGAPENPGIQFKAVRKIEDTKVGVVADGSLMNPKLTLYSTPTMSEENILALLLTGRSIDSLSQSEGNALANAAISLGVEGANKIAEKISESLGIKNITITSKTKADSTRVDIGTQINDRLTLGYGTTIDSKNEMNAGWIIEYRLSPSISFEAISGEEVSASITFKKQIDSKKLKLNKDQSDLN